MKINDFMLCNFVGDPETPPKTYVAEITDVDTLASTFKCYLPDTGQKFSFTYSPNSSGPWYGTDESGAEYDIDTHDIYTPGAIDPYPQGVAVVTFNDNKRFLCYVDSIEPITSVIMYNYPLAEISFENEIVSKSNWEYYPVGSQIVSIEGCVLVNNNSSPSVSGISGTIDNITQIAENSVIATYRWKERGIAPKGYIKGMALVFSRVYCKLKAQDPVALEMSKADTGNNEKDVLSWFSQEFLGAGMDNSIEGIDTLRHLFVLLIGLGMRESSGKYCQGRDAGASNTTSDTAEAGLFQTSFNIRSSNPLLPQLFNTYKNAPGFLEIFKEKVTCRDRDIENFGTGDGREYQKLAKECPAFAVEFTAIAARNRRKHWGPINKKTLEIKKECDDMLIQIQNEVDKYNLCPLVI